MSRQPTYDRDMVLDKALQTFWSNGYRGVDVEALTRTTGLNRHSLYRAFGGKKGIFHLALERYVETLAAQFIARLSSGHGLSAVVDYFTNATSSLGMDEGKSARRQGCFIVNTIAEMGRMDEQVNAIVDRFYSRIEQAFGDAVRRGQGDGTIRADLDPGRTAQWLVATSQGMSVGARFGRAANGISAALEGALAAPATQPQDCQ